MLKIAVIGSRDFPHEHLVRRLIQNLPRDWVVVSGCAPGVDTIALNEARALGIAYLEFPADWKGPLGKGAGFARNTTIVENSDLIVAFMEKATNGTVDTIKKAISSGKLYYVIATEEQLDEALRHFLDSDVV